MKFSIERSIVIDAGLDVVRPHIENMKNWRAWSPWSVLEPDHQQTYEGVDGELGSTMSWVGDVIGSGQLTMVAKQDQQLDYQLAFFAPWKSKAETSFLFTSDAGGTRVTWVMHSSMPFFLFFMTGMVKAMVGMDYDRGLTMLKSIVETGVVNADTSSQGVVDFNGFSYLGLARESHFSEMPDHMTADFQKLMLASEKSDFEPEHVLAVYNKVKLSKQIFYYTSAVSGGKSEVLKAELPLEEGEIPSQKMLEIKHRGSYKYLGNAWAMGHLTLRANKMKQNGSPFEYYHNDPSNTAEDELLTSIYFPIKV